MCFQCSAGKSWVAEINKLAVSFQLRRRTFGFHATRFDEEKDPEKLRKRFSLGVFLHGYCLYPKAINVCAMCVVLPVVYCGSALFSYNRAT